MVVYVNGKYHETTAEEEKALRVGKPVEPKTPVERISDLEAENASLQETIDLLTVAVLEG